MKNKLKLVAASVALAFAGHANAVAPTVTPDLTLYVGGGRNKTMFSRPSPSPCLRLARLTTTPTKPTTQRVRHFALYTASWLQPQAPFQPVRMC